MSIDWTKPIETAWTGTPAKVVWPDEAAMKTVEIQCGRFSYNNDGTPMPDHAFLGPVRNRIPDAVVQAALDAQWPGDECVYSEKHESAEAGMRAALTTAIGLLSENACPGHVASDADPKVCKNCGTHVDSLRPPDDEA